MRCSRSAAASIELGILRAIGLSAGQMTSFLAWELVFLIVTGLVRRHGTGRVDQQPVHPLPAGGRGRSGAHPALPGRDRLAGHLPHLRPVRAAVRGRAWSCWLSLLLRMKIFQAIKLGETV